MAQQQAIHKFVLGNKELEGKTAEFQYDRGWYSIADIVGEERNVIYKSRNMQEAYMKWNVYIGRKKERPVSEEHRREQNGFSDRREETGHSGDFRRENTRNRDNDNRRSKEHPKQEERRNGHRQSAERNQKTNRPVDGRRRDRGDYRKRRSGR